MKKLAAIVLGIALAGTATVAIAGRNSSGSYSLPAGNPVVSGTSISSTWANNTLGDLSAEITSSLDRNGRGGMLAPLRVPNGSAGTPTLSFTNETASGWYRAATGDLRLAIGGTDRCTVTSSGLSISGALTLSGKATSAATAGGDSATTLATKGYVDGSILKTGGALTLGTADANDVVIKRNNATAFTVLYDTPTGLTQLHSSGGSVINLPTPQFPDWAATKEYVDAGGDAPTWSSPTYGTQWSGTVQYAKKGGFVYLRGSINAGGSPGVAAFTLPAGYRPASTRVFSVVDQSSANTYANAQPVQIQTNGLVAVFDGINKPWTGGHTYWLDGIIFAAEQ